MRSGQVVVVVGMMKTEVVPGRLLAEVCTHRLAAYDLCCLLQASSHISLVDSFDYSDSVARV